MDMLCRINLKPEIWETLSAAQKGEFEAWRDRAEEVLNEAIVPALQRGDINLWTMSGITHNFVSVEAKDGSS